MSMKQENDSDLYGDLYDDEFLTPLEEEYSRTDAAVKEEPQVAEASESKTPPKPIPSIASSLPAKPQSADVGGMSYSAQIARQFSAYQQTPSQERQPRSAIPVSTNSQAGSSAIETHEGPADRSSQERPVRPSEMKDEGLSAFLTKMFIGGLNWDTTDEGLKKYFSQFGKVDACTIMRDPDGRSRGFAFLTFEEAESVTAVVSRDHFLDGKAIDPKRAIPREEHLRNTRYFVGGLSPSTTADTMRAFFSTYGKVVDATVMVDRESGRSKGFGFVTFEDSNNAEEFVGKLGLVLDEKQIEVKMAQPRSQRDQARTSNNTGQEAYFPETNSRTPNMPNMPFSAPQANPATNMLYQRMMGQMPMMGNGGMPNMNMMNPMMMGMGMGMGMGGGMNNFNQMGGMGGMNMMGGMNPMGGMNSMGGMRMGMGGPMGGMGMVPNAAAAMGMNNMNMRMRPGMAGIGGMNPNAGRMPMGTGLGPTRMSTRGQHSFHPYAR
ncbi:hnRNP A1-gamma isoform [Hygrophoropsis aurantiaca]|uniref:HnRNP A1-gamma isoform n=1 Tax=Hygrophoropsis aurantiaca TaxID=72124 RepID=A0ACB8AEM6_9AGAM|nr:hnRNP A1-gamma isoform [Hygrophoropsis aurantiaca]